MPVRLEVVALVREVDWDSYAAWRRGEEGARVRCKDGRLLAPAERQLFESATREDLQAAIDLIKQELALASQAEPASATGTRVLQRRNRGKPGGVQFVCLDTYHRDSREWAAYGCHLVGTLRVKQREDGAGCLDWTGHRAESRDRIATSGITLTVPGIAPDLPVKGRRRDDGEGVWRFRCSCGLDKQRSESDLAEIVASYSRAFPGTPVKIDIARL